MTCVLDKNDPFYYYMNELSIFDVEDFITLNILDVNYNKMTVIVNVTKHGGFFKKEYDLLEDEAGLYFEYGPDYTKLHLDDFMEVA